jgi:hypothetical protein
MLKAFPDFDKTSPEAIEIVVQKLATLSPEMLDRVCSLDEGLLTTSGYFPTVYTITEMVRKFTDAARSHISKPNGYEYFKQAEPDVKLTPEARAKALALAAEFRRGIWAAMSKDARVTPLDIRNFNSSSDLRSPDLPPSRELLADHAAHKTKLADTE